MKTKNIFKTLAFAMLMPTMLLTTACSSEDDLVNNTAGESTANTKGYALPVTVNVSRQGDEGTRATYDGVKRKLSFSTGDKLFVTGSHAEAGKFAGTLDYDAVSGKFSGTVTTQNEYHGTIDDLMASAAATLLPAGYGSYGFFSVSGSGYEATLTPDYEKAFALTKAAAVEQFSLEYASSYSSGFALKPNNSIVNFTISELTANKEVAVSFVTSGNLVTSGKVISGNVTTSAEGVATFAVGVSPYQSIEYCTLTVDGNNIAMPTDSSKPGYIFNISRSAAPATNLSTLSDDYVAQDGEILTGTLENYVKISIADGATVTLRNVNITNLGDGCNWAGINCEGDATLVLEGTNEVCPGSDDTGEVSNYPGIYIAEGYTLTIQGDGTLTAYSNAYEPYGAGIGGGYDIACGNIVINGGNIKATGGYYAAGIGSGGYGGYCGDITINGGTITATGGDYAAGIGSGWQSGYCGTITIKSTVISVTAYKGDGATNSIGAGKESPAITVTIEDNDKVTQD